MHAAYLALVAVALLAKKTRSSRRVAKNPLEKEREGNDLDPIASDSAELRHLGYEDSSLASRQFELDYALAAQHLGLPCTPGISRCQERLADAIEAAKAAERRHGGPWQDLVEEAIDARLPRASAG